jgi:hypothetical protein
MHDKNMEAILNDPASTQEEKTAAQAALHGQADPVVHLQAELLQTLAKPELVSVSYFDIHRFCSDRSWRLLPVRELYDRWFDAFLASETGQAYLQEIASHLLKHDFSEWKFAADEWKASGWKSTARLINVLQRIVESPTRGNYHSAETVEGARQFLVEMKRRAGEAH